MKCWRFDHLLQNDAWLGPVFLQTNENGIITKISEQGVADEYVPGWAVPGFQNAHSHAFQYAMAGLTEHNPPGSQGSDFWSWRESMYKLALQTSPDDLEAIATELYAQMLCHGYTSVAEFHYLHHDHRGYHYGNLAEMGERLCRAAHHAGIHLTLIPIFYCYGNFQTPPRARQLRFLSRSVDEYFSLLDATEMVLEKYSQHREEFTLGMGIHSLRAAGEKEIREIVKRAKGLPLHIHVAEQRKEVSDCVKSLGKRPVEWLLENVGVEKNFFLVHATHMNKAEAEALAKTEATVVLCPSTEGNLGDGFFPMETYWKSGGHWCIGTDSHVGLSPMEELRWLDYAQRLKREKRQTFCSTKVGADDGALAFRESLVQGRWAMGNKVESYFEVGAPLDACVFNTPLLGVTSPQRRLATIIYTGYATSIQSTIVSGKWAVKEGKHIHGEKIRSNFLETLKSLALR